MPSPSSPPCCRERTIRAYRLLDEDKLRASHVDRSISKKFTGMRYSPQAAATSRICAQSMREQALRLGVYWNPAQEGCHDWKLFRFARAGLPPVHVPEILYSWRMHDASTAANVNAKDFVIDSGTVGRSASGGKMAARNASASKLTCRCSSIRLVDPAGAKCTTAQSHSCCTAMVVPRRRIPPRPRCMPVP